MRNVALAIIGWLFSVSAAFASIGIVTELTGTAIVKRGDQSIAIEQNLSIEISDQIETKNGTVKITFNDNTVITVTESSSLSIKDFKFNQQTRRGNLNLRANLGTVRYVSGEIAHQDPKQVNIQTPTATIAVRGTDFVMAVQETGSSMIMLMPTCEIENNINLKGLTCGSGKIDVETPVGVVNLDKPYQATLVDTSNSMPSEPVIVMLNGMGINNNLFITPPITETGQTIITLAKNAARQTGITRPDSINDDNDNERQQVATRSDRRVKEKTEEKTSTDIKIPGQEEKDYIANQTASRSETDNEFVFELWKDKSETIQVGWQYESLSQNNRNYTSIVMPVDTKVQVIVSQDMQVNSYLFATSPQGSITVVQNFR